MYMYLAIKTEKKLNSHVKIIDKSTKNHNLKQKKLIMPLS